VNIHETLSCIFPSGVIGPGVPEHGGFFEVLGLPKGVVPQNCERVASGRSRPRVGQEVRESYLVRTADYLLFFRACPAHTNRGHNAFVMSCGFAPLLGPRSQDLEAYALRCMNAHQ
jgi:hypothetical protein